jgi:DNA-binding NtrC family response regulator
VRCGELPADGGSVEELIAALQVAMRAGRTAPQPADPAAVVVNQTEAARALNLPLRTLVHKIQTYGIKKKFDR